MYAPDGSKLFVLSYVDDCVYWCTSEKLGKCFVDTLGNRFHVKFLGYAHWFVSISISQLRDHYISVDHVMYDTSTIAKYLDTATVKENSKSHNITLPHDILFSNEYDSTSD